MIEPGKRAWELTDIVLAQWQHTHDSLRTAIARACEIAMTEEREACAKVADRRYLTSTEIAAHIRARADAGK